MIRKFLFLIVAQLIAGPAFVLAQKVSGTVPVPNPEEKFALYSQLLSPEKLYLHTDREVYCVGDTIWLKGYLKNNSLAAEFAASNYIYVELLSSMMSKDYTSGSYVMDQDVRTRVKIKRTDSLFCGYVVIPENLNTGIAVVRGYTYWMMNREPEYMFFKNIEIRNPVKDDFVSTMANDKVRDSYKYSEVGVKNPYVKEKEQKRDMDVQFMPESGRYLRGHSSVIAFKAVNEQGRGIKVEGDVFGGDIKMTGFCSNDLGMGKLNLYVDDTVKELYAVVRDSSGLEKKIMLPMPAEQAIIVHIQPDTSSVLLNVENAGVVSADSMFVLVHDGTEIYFKIPYQNDGKTIRLENRFLTPGINNAAVMDKKGNVYAERSFFVYPDHRVSAGFSINKEQYAAREKVACRLDLKDKEGRLLAGNFSVAVTDDLYAPYSGAGYTIQSYLLLGSELGGFVENPQYYFDKNIPFRQRVVDMDVLMLTQGWKYYDLPEILKGKSLMPYFGREYKQSLCGKVYGLFGQAKKSIVSFLAPSIRFTAMGQLDSSGYFVLEDLDFPENTKFIVAAVGLGGAQRKYTPALEDDIFAARYKYPDYLSARQYTDTYKNAALADFYNSGGELVYSLNPVYITGTKTSREENVSPMPMHQFKPGQYRGEKDLEQYQTYDLMDYIVTTCPPLKYGDAPVGSMDIFNLSGDSSLSISSSNRTILCRTQRVASKMDISTGWAEIIVYINGIQATCADLEGMQVSDITGFAYLKGAEAAQFGVYAADALSPRSVVMIKTKMMDRGGAVNITNGTPIGWQQPRHMYVPKYDNALALKAKEPMRSTLYWNPNLSVKDGVAEMEFYTSDHKSDYTIVIEGLTEEGDPVFLKNTIKR